MEAATPRASLCTSAACAPLLEEAGSDLSHIVKTTTDIIDPRYREPVYQEIGKWLKGVFPISTGLVISGLGQPQWLMEIDVIAVVPDDWQPNQK